MKNNDIQFHINGLWDLVQNIYCEVIGNIHDNPELMEVET